MSLRIIFAAFALAAVAALAALLFSASAADRADVLAGKHLYYTAWGETAYACIYCHADFDESRPRDTYRRPAHPLVGVASRASYFTGAYQGPGGIGLARAVNTCVVAWLGSEALPSGSDELAALVAYLDSISTDAADATAPVAIEKGGAFADAPVGNPHRGEKLFHEACLICHRAGGPTSRYDFAIPRSARSVWDRVRGYQLTEAEAAGGADAKMPFFSTDRLGDQGLSDVISYLEWQFALAVPVQPQLPLLRKPEEPSRPPQVIEPEAEAPPDDEPPSSPNDTDGGATEDPPVPSDND